MDRCYMCESLATSREHAPPRCLFPESKDIPGKSYRQNLITVPSCDLHNMGKSRDDEFLMVSLAGIIGNNSIGYRHKFGKVNKAVRRSANRLLEEVFAAKKRIFCIEVKPNKFIDVIWGTPDAERLHRCFESIARGLHFHHYGDFFRGNIRVYLGYLHPESQNEKSFNSFLKRKFEIELDGKAIFGENQEIFFYQVTDADRFGLYAMRLCFYGGLNIYTAFIPDGATKPCNLAMELVNRGIPTVISLGDERFIFNDDGSTKV
ncbi:hypothetical protein AL486_09945 [Pandoraea apista]|uniref:hypothetical protein n=1 Tax=Pandoraea apista TaxID=93218 RepID=UPI000CE94DF8|nr:hypothetical protein [Pandoraea apista]AVF39991.1 hypothetical protein AL486_09945 [Pandoraea apista]